MKLSLKASISFHCVCSLERTAGKGVLIILLRWFSNRTGTSVDDGARNQTTSLTNGRVPNWVAEVEFSPFRALSRSQITFSFCCQITLFLKPQWLLPNSELKQRRRRRRRQRERQKRNRYTLAKQQLCTCITLFCTFVCRHCTTTTWKSSKFYVFWRMWTQESDFLSPFLNFHTVFWNSSPGKNCQIANRTRWNKRDKVWSNSNPLLSDVSVAVAIVVGLPNVSWLTTPWRLPTSPSTSPGDSSSFCFWLGILWNTQV